MISIRNVQDRADRDVWLIRNAAHSMPVSGGKGANEAMTNTVYLAEHLANRSIFTKNEFKKRYHDWRRVIDESEKRISEMHGRSSPSLRDCCCEANDSYLCLITRFH